MRMKVTVYSTTWCPYCVMAKDYFTSKEVKYKDIDVEKDAKAAEEMIRKSGQMGVPVIDIDGKIIVGFDRRGIDHALASAK
jgi:glutaredoxin-like YruB-family protein